MKVNRAESVASFESVLNVLGSEQKSEITAVMAAKPMVQTLWLVMVFKYFAPTRQCSA
jgi:hypothetical protein